MLWRQHIIHNLQLLLLATVAYVGVIFIVLSISQIENGFQPHNISYFQGFLIVFVAIFGVLYVGHSFPAFRSKESTITYLLTPASVPEKFVFEFLSRIGIMILLLPLLYWITFHLQGYFFTMVTSQTFEPIGMQYLIKFDVPDVDNQNDYRFWIYAVISASLLLAFVLAFTGAAMFTKQPLVKTLFSLAVVMIFYFGYSYLVFVKFGVEKYSNNETMWLIPTTEAGALKFFTIAIILAIGIMMFVAYRKLKEREV